MNNVTPQSVLLSLTTEDRLWAIEELVREQGDRIGVLDAIAELDAIGLEWTPFMGPPAVRAGGW